MLHSALKKERIANLLRQEIQDGIYPVGFALPGELLLVKQYGVARETLRSALAILAEEGLLEKVHGKGNFVRFAPRDPAKIKRVLVIANIGGNSSLPCHTLIPKLENHAAAAGMCIDILEYNWASRMSRIQLGALLEKRQIDCVIMIANNFSGKENILDILRALPLPVFLPFASVQDIQCTSWPGCVWNLAGGWEMALRHLHSCGHLRVATMAMPDNGFLRGINPEYYGALLRRIGLDDDPELMARDGRIFPFSEQSEVYIEKEMARMLQLRHPPSAVLCHSDYWAGAVYRAAERFGKKIPDDLAVMGFVSGFNCEYISPTLSSVEIDMDEICRITFAYLKELAEGCRHSDAKSPPLFELALKLCCRESTGIIQCNPRSAMP